MSAEEELQQIDCTLAVIRDLNQFEPRSVKDRRTPLENRAEWLSTRCMGYRRTRDDSILDHSWKSRWLRDVR